MTSGVVEKVEASDWAIERLAEFIATVPKAHGEEAVGRSRRAILDTIGCMLYGADEPVTRTALSCVSGWGTGPVPVVGADTGLPAPWAAFVNGASAHSLDYDDWDDPGLTHTSAILVPAILAVLAGKQRPGLDLIDAHILGVETIIRIGEAVNPNHYDRGWHSTSTVGALGAAAACARAKGLDADATARALSLATSMAGGFVSQFGSMAKPIHAGLAAKAGVLAASLAGCGATARPDTLDGPVSFASLMTDASAEEFARALAKLGDPWAILEHGLHIKIYPSCGGTHRVIEAALGLREAHGLKSDDIESVSISVQDFLCSLLPYGIPKDTYEALFSFPYCVAAAFCLGRVGVDDFSAAALGRDDVLDLAARVRVEPRPTLGRERLFLAGDPDTVTVTTRAGETLSAGVDVPLGAPPRHADDAVVERKFLDCARRKIPETRAVAIRDLLVRPPHDWSVDELLSVLRKVDPEDRGTVRERP